MDHFSENVIGIDLGDKTSVVCLFDVSTGAISESGVSMAEGSFREHFESFEPCRVMIEAGGQSRWVKRVLSSMGFDVTVADPRQLSWITKSHRKNDRNDAVKLARLCASDLGLVNPIEHRDDQMQADLAVLKMRDSLVRNRTEHITEVRGLMKSLGLRLAKKSSSSFHLLADEIPPVLKPALDPMMILIGELTAKIREFDRRIESILEERYPDAHVLLKIRGVGALTALLFRLTLARADRFKRSREAAAYLGLCPRQHESGAIKKQLGISKAGDAFTRRILVQCAHYILGPFGEDCDLRRWGEKLAKRGGKAAKKRAAVAVARKLAVVMHRIWADQSEYEPLRNAPVASS